LRFTTYLLDGQPRLAVVDGDSIVDLANARPGVPSDLRAALAAGIDLKAEGAAALASNAARLPLAAQSLAPLVPEPGKTICLGLNYYDHAKEGGREKPDYPWFFYRGKSSLMGHGQPGVVPRVSSKFDYEAEMAVVIGKTVPRHTKRADALPYVFGYSCFNDMSVRDYQKRTGQWTIGKNFDATGGFGPMLVTADELSPGATGLRIQTRLNGQVMQDANTSDMIFAVDETIELLAECMTLEPGDAIIMGTPAGVGQARTPPVWMKAGDTVEIEIERIGVLRNPIVAEA
jgi:2-keto-4-pentenoate hydratase/2-oxohepta-3-ene-1,7-dioic acid hydratase in catechol pathway